MNYLIFSDESGYWKEGDYYIRAWIKITPEQYESLRKEIIFLKHETGVKELKWGRYIKKPNNFKSIFSIDFKVFITISIPRHFQDRSENKYNIIKTLMSLRNDQFTGEDKFIEIIRNKIVGSAKHTLFLNYFEKQHIENSKKALVNNIDPSKYKYIIDTPQSIDKDWVDLASECEIINIDIEKKSEKVPGIELADVVAGCMHEYLRGNPEANKTYKNYIKNKMLDMNSKEYPNPNLIFYQDFSPEEKKCLDIFR